MPPRKLARGLKFRIYDTIRYDIETIEILLSRQRTETVRRYIGSAHLFANMQFFSFSNDAPKIIFFTLSEFEVNKLFQKNRSALFRRCIQFTSFQCQYTLLVFFDLLGSLFRITVWPNSLKEMSFWLCTVVSFEF